MVTFKQEYLCEVVNEVDALLQLHYEEIGINQDRIKLEPRWQQYGQLEQAGAFIVFAARDNGKLIGYGAFFVNNHMHHESLVHAHNDVIFLHPKYRKGMDGINLIKACEQGLIKAKVDKITFNAKPGTQLVKILERLGYAIEEYSIGKFLKGN